MFKRDVSPKTADDNVERKELDGNAARTDVAQTNSSDERFFAVVLACGSTVSGDSVVMAKTWYICALAESFRKWET